MMQPRKAAGLLQDIGAQGSNDTILAHITPGEAALLKARGGSGKRDPRTGLLHFDDSSSNSSDSSGSGDSYSSSGYGPSTDGMASMAGYGGAPSYTGFGEGYTPATTDPTYNAKGYYSAAGGYLGGDDADANPTRYYSDRNTLAGNIADHYGIDPEGFGAKAIDVGLSLVSGLAGPWGKIGLAVARSIASSGSNPHKTYSDGDRGQTGYTPFSMSNLGKPSPNTPENSFTRQVSTGLLLDPRMVNRRIA